jgi:putative hydrolase of the HAD superfamily
MSLIKLKKPLGIIFDLGGTIIKYSSSSFLRGTERVLRYAIKNPKNATAEEIQRYADELNKDLLERREKVMMEYNCICFQRYIYDSFGIEFSKTYDELEKIFCDGAFDGKCCDGISELLDVLNKHNIKVGALSNSSFSGESLRFELRKYSGEKDFDSRFSFIISTADYCFRKPDKRIFDLAIKKMGLPPEELWFIGDSIEYDIKGAVRAGLNPIWYNENNQSLKDEIRVNEINTYYELIDKIEKLY